MRTLRHLIQTLPLYAWLLALPLIIIPPLWLVAAMIGIHVFYPYLSAYEKGYAGVAARQLPGDIGLILSAGHWLIVYGLCRWLTRRLPDEDAILASAGIMVASIILAYITLSGAGYTVEIVLR